MKDLSEYLAEKLKVNKDYNYDGPDDIDDVNKPDTKWVAIEVTTSPDHYHSKPITTQRVVTVDTYNELKSKGYTKGHMSIENISTLGPVCRSKQAAMDFLDPPKKTARKSNINKGDADYVVWAMAIGKLSPNGKTSYDWNIWDESAKNEKAGHSSVIYADEWGHKFLWGSAGSLNPGDKIFVIDNDSQKKLPGAPKNVKVALPCSSKEEFADAYRAAFPNRCKSPKRAFGKIIDGIPWGDMNQIYSIKGVAEDA